MFRFKSFSRVVTLVLIASVFFSACDTPDVSKFAEQSSEMTRGIGKGIKDTESVIRTASERKDLYSEKTIKELNLQLKKYQRVMKPTLKTLDSLDAYLEALNTLSQANKKSGENAKAVVDSVGNLVSAVSGIQLAESTVNLAAGILTLAEQFRTSRDFKKRVNLAALIVEGKTHRVINAKTGEAILIKSCTIESIDAILASQGSKEQKEAQIADKGCGVIDLLKFTVRDLKEINLAVSPTTSDNFRNKHKVLIDFRESIIASNGRIQNELQLILNSKGLIQDIRELEINKAPQAAIKDKKIDLKQFLDDLFARDGQLRLAVIKEMETCGAACANMKRFFEFDLSNARESQILEIIGGITKDEFDRSNGLIEPLLDTRAISLRDQNEGYLADLDRITPSYDAVTNELAAIKEKQNRLNSLLDTSMAALDAWAESHANLRVAVNSKKPLTVAKLTSKVKEIWEIINPKQAD